MMPPFGAWELRKYMVEKNGSPHSNLRTGHFMSQYTLLVLIRIDVTSGLGAVA